LAATGALAVACFIKVTGIVFLGEPRTAAAREASESPRQMLLPMGILATACCALGLAPGLIAPALERTVGAWAGLPLAGASAGPRLAGLAPLGWISITGAALLAAVFLLACLVIPTCRRARRRQAALPTWDCGYGASSPRLQYTASSFAEIVTSRFDWALRPQTHEPRIERLFPAPARFHSHVDDTVLDAVVRPAGRLALLVSAWFRSLPGGQLQRYIVYILLVLVPLLIWALAGGGAGR
jgi:NADH:ubiquinone oxidoreductase subunit 5 (subunit L)/multisubunit Na+/H+ antiporter MnhA subunit